MKVEKLLLIYKFTILGESNTKLIADMCESGKTSLKAGRNFARYTEEENKSFLLNWYRRNKIKIKDYKVYTDLTKAPKNKEGLPIIVKKVTKNVIN